MISWRHSFFSEPFYAVFNLHCRNYSYVEVTASRAKEPLMPSAYIADVLGYLYHFFKDLNSELLAAYLRNTTF